MRGDTRNKTMNRNRHTCKRKYRDTDTQPHRHTDIHAYRPFHEFIFFVLGGIFCARTRQIFSKYFCVHLLVSKTKGEKTYLQDKDRPPSVSVKISLSLFSSVKHCLPLNKCQQNTKPCQLHKYIACKDNVILAGFTRVSGNKTGNSIWRQGQAINMIHGSGRESRMLGAEGVMDSRRFA